MRTAAQAVAWMKGEAAKPTRNLKGLCQMSVRLAFGQPPSGVPDAHAGWAKTKQKVTSGSTFMKPPAGAPVYWQGGAHGHAALSAGNGYIYSTDIRRSGKVDRVPLTEIAKKWGYKYKGYGKDYVGTPIVFAAAGGGTGPAPAPSGTTLAKGIDISRHQDGISFAAIASAVDFLYIKCSEGQQTVSTTWAKQWKATGDAKILRGAYHFAGTGTNTLGSPITEARNFANRLKAAGFRSGYDLPPVLDMENHGNKSKALLTQWCLDFCQEVDRILGLTAKGSWLRTGVYMNPNFRDNKLTAKTVLSGRWLWLAQWPTTYDTKWPPATAMPSGVHLWQFTDSISVAGKAVDGDVTTKANLQKFAPNYFAKGDEFDMATLADLEKALTNVLNRKVKPGEAASKIGNYSEDLQKNGATIYQYAIGADCKGNAALANDVEILKALTFLGTKLVEVASKPAMTDEEVTKLAAEVSLRIGKLSVRYELPQGDVIP